MLTRRTLIASPLLLALGGCSNPSTTGTNAPAANTPAPAGAGLKVGLVTAGSLADSGWNSLAGQGLDQIKSELGAETAHQAAGTAQMEEALRGFARDGFKLIFAHGSEFGDAALRIAKEYPEVFFVVSSGEAQAGNVASLVFDFGEATYLAGMAAAGLSKSGKAGQIGGQDFPPVVQGFKLFEQGGRAVNPKFETKITYLGNWSDANMAKERALGMINDGADILFQNCDAAGAGIFQAAEEQQGKGILVIGSNANQNDLKPEIIPASAVIDVPKTFMTVAKDVQAGNFQGGIYRENVKSGTVYLAISDRFKDQIPADVRKKIAEAEQAIKDGKLKLV